MLTFFSSLKFNVNLLKKTSVLYDHNDFINKINDKCARFWRCAVARNAERYVDSAVSYIYNFVRLKAKIRLCNLLIIVFLNKAFDSVVANSLSNGNMYNISLLMNNIINFQTATIGQHYTIRPLRLHKTLKIKIYVYPFHFPSEAQFTEPKKWNWRFFFQTSKLCTFRVEWSSFFTESTKCNNCLNFKYSVSSIELWRFMAK